MKPMSTPDPKLLQLGGDIPWLWGGARGDLTVNEDNMKNVTFTSRKSTRRSMIGPEVQRSRGPEVQRSRGPEVQRSRGPEVQRSRGPEVQRSERVPAHREWCVMRERPASKLVRLGYRPPRLAAGHAPRPRCVVKRRSSAGRACFRRRLLALLLAVPGSVRCCPRPGCCPHCAAARRDLACSPPCRLPPTCW